MKKTIMPVKKKLFKSPLFCHLCNGSTRYVMGIYLFPKRPDFYKKWFLMCSECRAYVRCKRNSMEPLGIVANKKLRRKRIRAHAAFDQLWESEAMTRDQAYSWLASMLRLSTNKCHIGEFDIEQCNEVIRLSKELTQQLDGCSELD